MKQEYPQQQNRGYFFLQSKIRFPVICWFTEFPIKEFKKYFFTEQMKDIF